MTVRFDWIHGDRSSGGEVDFSGEHICEVYACLLPDLTGDNPGFWSLDVPIHDEATDMVTLRPHGMGRAASLEAAMEAAEKAARRFCAGALELVA